MERDQGWILKKRDSLTGISFLDSIDSWDLIRDLRDLLLESIDSIIGEPIDSP